jgi:outer membrane protein assembly factor BamB
MQSLRDFLVLTAILPGVSSFIAAGQAGAADWPQWLGPDRNGVTSEVVAPWTDPPAVVWRQPVGNGYSSPIVSEGMVFFHAAVAGKQEEQVQALDANTGKVVWTDIYARGEFRSQLGVGPRTTPTVSGGKLITYGITGVLTCYEAKTGKRLWQTNPYETFSSPLPRFGVCSSPAVTDGRVIVLVGGGTTAVAAYDVNSGELAWKGLEEPAGSASPIVLTRTIGGQPQTEVVVQTTLRLLGLSSQDGAVRWEHPLVFQPNGVSPTPLSVGKMLVCTTQDTGTLALQLPEGGSAGPELKWWKQDANSYFSTGTLGPTGSILVVTNVLMPLPRADLRCIDLEKGETLWTREGLGYFHFGAISTGDGKLLLLEDTGHATLAEVTRQEFKTLARSQVSRGTLTSPAFAGGKLYVRDDKEIVCLQLNPPSAGSETK